MQWYDQMACETLGRIYGYKDICFIQFNEQLFLGHDGHTCYYCGSPFKKSVL